MWCTHERQTSIVRNRDGNRLRNSSTLRRNTSIHNAPHSFCTLWITSGAPACVQYHSSLHFPNEENPLPQQLFMESIYSCANSFFFHFIRLMDNNYHSLRKFLVISAYKLQWNFWPMGDYEGIATLQYRIHARQDVSVVLVRLSTASTTTSLIWRLEKSTLPAHLPVGYFLCGGDRIWTCDLWVMSPTSYRTTPRRCASNRDRTYAPRASTECSTYWAIEALCLWEQRVPRSPEAAVICWSVRIYRIVDTLRIRRYN